MAQEADGGEEAERPEVAKEAEEAERAEIIAATDLIQL